MPTDGGEPRTGKRDCQPSSISENMKDRAGWKDFFRRDGSPRPRQVAWHHDISIDMRPHTANARCRASANSDGRPGHPLLAYKFAFTDMIVEHLRPQLEAGSKT